MNFTGFATTIAKAAAHPAAFLIAVAVVLGWAAFGPAYQWSDAHSLFINTLTTIVTFFLGFLILNTQNRDTVALHAKVDELISAQAQARNDLIGIEARSSEEIEALRRTRSE